MHLRRRVAAAENDLRVAEAAHPTEVRVLVAGVPHVHSGEPPLHGQQRRNTLIWFHTVDFLEHLQLTGTIKNVNYKSPPFYLRRPPAGQ